MLFFPTTFIVGKNQEDLPSTHSLFFCCKPTYGKYGDLPMSNIPPRGATVSDGPSLWKKKRGPPFAVAAIPKPEPSPIPLRSVWHYADVFPFPFSLSLFGLGGEEGTGDDDKSALSLNSGLVRNGARGGGLVEWEKSQFSYAAVPPPRKRQWLQLIIPTSSGCTTHPRLVADTARDTQREGRETKINCPIRPTAAFLSYYFETRKKPRRFTKYFLAVCQYVAVCIPFQLYIRRGPQ